MSTKDRILDEALTLFSENGYDGTSVEQIAEKVGIKAPSLYKHFKGKEDILNAIIDNAEAHYEESFGSEKNIGRLPESKEEFVRTTMDKISFTIHDPMIRRIRKFLVQEQFRSERLAEITTRHQLDGLLGMYTIIIGGMMDNGDIGVNFFIRLTEEEAAYATVDFTWIVNGEEKTATVYMSDAEKTDHGYKATCHIAPAEMTYQITATIELDGTEHTDIYAAADYADVILTDSEFASKYVAAENIKGKDGDQRLADLRYLVKTMLDYGAKAQIQFKRDSEVELANKKLVTDDQTSPYYFKPGEVDANSITTGADNMYEADFSNLGLEYKGTTIVFLTETSLRHYFKITDQGKFDLVKGSINFGSDEKIGYTEKNGEIYFELKNIAAADLDTLCTLINNGDPYKYSVLEYVKACLKSTKTSDNMKALAAATYRYNQAANVYFV